ncbi:MAG: AcrB/AcrD/AcrF family protein [Epsilonproteobacteria bacterium]|nr:MAG: AcrB/AcrD/AcrF family protein [Campylobacterota bacterium]
MARKELFIERFVYDLLESPLKKFVALLVMFIILVSSVWLVTSELVKVKLLPKPLADNFSIYVDLPEGKSVYETKEVTECILNHLKNEEIITDMSVFYGESAPVDFSAMLKGRLFEQGENIANILVNLKREDERDETSIDAVHRLRTIINTNCTMYDNKIKMVESPAGPPSIAALVLEVTGGEGYDDRLDLSEKLLVLFEATPRLVDFDILRDEPYQKYGITLNAHKIMQSGLQIEQVTKILYLAFKGMDIAYDNNVNAQNQVSIHLTLNQDSKGMYKASKLMLEQSLASLMLLNAQGMTIPVIEVVEVAIEQSNPRIVSKNLSPMIAVVAETDMESQIYSLLYIQNKILNDFSDSYDVEKVGLLDLSLRNKQSKATYLLHWEGEQKVSMDTVTDLGMAMGVAIVFIFFMMVIYYKNFALAGAIVLASFISVAGVIYAHLIYDMFTPHTFYMTGTSLIGFIALIGINSRNSLLIIDFAQQLMDEKGMDARKAIAVAIQTRAKPILLTVLAIIFASMLLATDPVFGGLGIALIGGTLAAYAVSLLIVPIMIYRPLKKEYLSKGESDV